MAKEGAQEKQMADHSGNKMMKGMKRVMAVAKQVDADLAELHNKTPSPQQLNNQMLNLSEEQAARLGPEARSLWELRNSPDLFAEQYQRLEEDGSMEYLGEDLSVISEMQPSVLQDVTIAAPTISSENSMQANLAPQAPSPTFA